MYHAGHSWSSRSGRKKNKVAVIRKALLFLILCTAFVTLITLKNNASWKGTHASFNDTESASIQFNIKIGNFAADAGQQADSENSESSVPASSSASESESKPAQEASSQSAESQKSDSSGKENGKTNSGSSSFESSESSRSEVSSQTGSAPGR